MFDATLSSAGAALAGNQIFSLRFDVHHNLNSLNVILASSLCPLLLILRLTTRMQYSPISLLRKDVRGDTKPST